MEHTYLSAMYLMLKMSICHQTINSLCNNYSISDAKVLDSDMEMDEEETPVIMDGENAYGR